MNHTMSNEREVAEVIHDGAKTGRDEITSLHEFVSTGVDIKAIREKIGLSHTTAQEMPTIRQFVQTGADIKAIREKVGLSQREFAALLCISKRTLEGWEQGHRTLNGPARALLTIFKNDPEGAVKALHGNK